MDNPIYRQKLINIGTGATTATGGSNSTAVDMQGWDSVTFLGRFAAAATDSIMNVAGGTATGSVSDYAGTGVRNKTGVRITVYRPIHRYVRAEYASATTVAVGDTWAILSSGRQGAVAATDNVGEFHASPAVGTA